MSPLSNCQKIKNGTNKYQKNRLMLVFPCRYLYSVFVIVFTFITHFPGLTISEFEPSFVWSAVNKSLDEDRLMIVDAYNDKVKIKGCARVLLYNEGSVKYAQANYSGRVIFVDVSEPDFATDSVQSQVEQAISKINPGKCIPCTVFISLVNISAFSNEEKYRNADFGEPPPDKEAWKSNLKPFEDYKRTLSQNFDLLLQFGTPIQARYLILVRLVEKKEDLTKCHGKKYTKYPQRLVPIWEQVLFNHFKDARVIQGATESGSSQTTLVTSKESGIWVWMCEEVIHRMRLQDQCNEGSMTEERCQKLENNNKLATADVVLTDLDQCRVYRPRT